MDAEEIFRKLSAGAVFKKRRTIFQRNIANPPDTEQHPPNEISVPTSSKNKNKDPEKSKLIETELVRVIRMYILKVAIFIATIRPRRFTIKGIKTI